MSVELHVLESIPAYALGSLEADEADAIARHLATCPNCQAELSRYQALVDALVLAAPEAEPPPGLHDRLLQQLEINDTQSSGTNFSGRQKLKHFLRQPRSVWGVAAVAAILILLIGNVMLWTALQNPVQPTPRPDVMQTIPLFPTEAVPGAHGMLVIGLAGYEGALMVEDLPPLPPDKTYQFWLANGEERVSAAQFTVDEKGYGALVISAPMPLTGYSGFGITLESIEGSQIPTGDRVLRWGTEKGRKP
jgi:anti-sigma-K factor RskA